MWKGILTLLSSLLLIGVSLAQGYFGPQKQFHQSWLNLNYVPCENLGVTASGKIELSMDYVVVMPGQPNSATLVKNAYLTTSYVHEIDASASISFNSPAGNKTVSLVRPWYSTIGPPNLVQLILPKAYQAPGAPPWPPQLQQAEMVRNGTPITLNVSIRFPQDGGNCFATFKQTFTLN